MSTIHVGILEAVLRAKDDMSPGLKAAIGNLERLAGVAAKTLPLALGAAAAAAGAAAAAIVALGKRGAEVADVQQAFQGLTAATGDTADAMLGALQKGTLNTISNFDLMKLANTALGTGMIKSAAEMDTLAAGAQLLADRTGGSTAQAFDTLTSAMATGRMAGLKQMGMFVDTKVAVEAYAKSIGKSVDSLSDQERATANGRGALAALRQELEANGRATADFGDFFAQARTRIDNFKDSLGVAIATSPALQAGMKAAGEALDKAFGANQADTIKTLMGFVNDFGIGLVKTGEVGVEVARFLTNAWQGVNVFFNAMLAKQAGELAAFTAAVRKAAELSAFVGGGQAAKEAARQLRSLEDGLKSFAGQSAAAAEQHIESAGKINGTFDTMAAGLAKTREAMEAARGKTAELSGAHTTGAKAAEVLAAKTADLAATLDREKIVTEGVQRAIEQMFDAQADGIAKAAEELELKGSLRAEIERATIARDKEAHSLRGLAMVIAPTTGLWTRYADVVEQELENASAAVREHAAAAASMTGIKAALGAAIQGLPQVILGALQGGGDVGKAAGAHLGSALGQGIAESSAKFLTQHLGKTLGGALGSILPGLGSILGSLGGTLIDKLFGPSEHERVNRIRDSYISAAGGFEGLAKKAGAAAPSLDLVKKLLDAKTVKDYEAAIRDLQGAFDTQVQAQEALNAAVERYGFSIEELGPTMRRQELEKMAGQLLQDWRVLTAAKIDAVAIIDRMGPAMNEYVQTALKAGGEIPAAMRPMIEEFIKSGKLLDANGNAFESAEAAGITFTQTMSEQFQTLIEKIDAFVSILSGIKPPPIRIPVEYEVVGGIPTGAGTHQRFDVPGLSAGDAMFQPRKPQLVVMGEGPHQEFAHTRPQMEDIIRSAVSAAGGGGRDIVVHSHLILDGREIHASVKRIDGASVK